MKEKQFNKIKECLLNIDSNSDEATLEASIIAFERACYEPFYENLMNGWIFDKEGIFDAMDFYIRVKELDKVKAISIILNKYYDGFLTEKFNEFLSEEKYEMCEVLKKLIK